MDEARRGAELHGPVVLEGQVLGGTSHKGTGTQGSPEAEGPGSEREDSAADSNRPTAKDHNRASTDHKGNRAREVPGRNTSRGPGTGPTELIEQGDNGGTT